MPKIVLREDIQNGVKLGIMSVDTDDLTKPNWAGSGKTAKQLIQDSPDATGYSKADIDKLYEAGVFTLSEKDTAKAKASK